MTEERKARYFECTGIRDQWQIVSGVVRADSPGEARKAFRTRFKRGALTGYTISVRETSAEAFRIAGEKA